jgi:hypothetical protein
MELGRREKKKVDLVSDCTVPTIGKIIYRSKFDAEFEG